MKLESLQNLYLHELKDIYNGEQQILKALPKMVQVYGTIRNYARRLGFEDQARLLQQTLQEEMETDKKLTNIADSYINEEAKSAR